MKTADALLILLFALALVTVGETLNRRLIQQEKTVIAQSTQIADLTDQVYLQEKMIKKLAQEVRR